MNYLCALRLLSYRHIRPDRSELYVPADYDTLGTLARISNGDSSHGRVLQWSRNRKRMKSRKSTFCSLFCLLYHIKYPLLSSYTTAYFFHSNVILFTIPPAWLPTRFPSWDLAVVVHSLEEETGKEEKQFDHDAIKH